MWDVWLDLVLGSSCAVCDCPGRALCRACAHRLPARAMVARPTPCPPGLLPVRAAGEYAEELRALVVSHKEHRRLALARPLGRLLAVAVHELLEQPTPVVLVPVPSHRSVVRGRGHDPLLRLTREAAARLRREGVPARVVPALRVASRPTDQAGLDAASRAANVHGRFALRGTGGLAGPTSASRSVVLVDDVMTTGATLREAQRALESDGVRPAGAAVVAATRRRRVPGTDAGPRLSVPPRCG